MNDHKLRRLLEDVVVVSTPVDSEDKEPQESGDTSLTTSIVGVMASYQNANRWMDIIKEDLLINKGTVFFSEFVHDLAHTMPVRFDKFGDILHTANILVPYPPTEDIPYPIDNISDVFKALFEILGGIRKSLQEFIKTTEGTEYHSMSCKSEELLIDIDSEFENLYHMQRVYDICQDSIRFDKWVNVYLKR